MNEQHLPSKERCNTQLQINKELLCSKEMLIEGLVNSKPYMKLQRVLDMLVVKSPKNSSFYNT